MPDCHDFSISKLPDWDFLSQQILMFKANHKGLPNGVAKSNGHLKTSKGL